MWCFPPFEQLAQLYYENPIYSILLNHLFTQIIHCIESIQYFVMASQMSCLSLHMIWICNWLVLVPICKMCLNTPERVSGGSGVFLITVGKCITLLQRNSALSGIKDFLCVGIVHPSSSLLQLICILLHMSVFWFLWSGWTIFSPRSSPY